MNKEEVKKIINELKGNYDLLNELEQKARNYKNVGTPHNLDGHILFELEMLQEKLTTILYHFYLGDIEKDYMDRKITIDEKLELMESKKGKMPFENQEPFFSFGYMISDFTDNLDNL